MRMEATFTVHFRQESYYAAGIGQNKVRRSWAWPAKGNKNHDYVTGTYWHTCIYFRHRFPDDFKANVACYSQTKRRNTCWNGQKTTVHWNMRAAVLWPPKPLCYPRDQWKNLHIRLNRICEVSACPRNCQRELLHCTKSIPFVRREKCWRPNKLGKYFQICNVVLVRSGSTLLEWIEIGRIFLRFEHFREYSIFGIPIFKIVIEKSARTQKFNHEN